MMLFSTIGGTSSSSEWPSPLVSANSEQLWRRLWNVVTSCNISCNYEYYIVGPLRTGKFQNRGDSYPIGTSLSPWKVDQLDHWDLILQARALLGRRFSFSWRSHAMPCHAPTDHATSPVRSRGWKRCPLVQPGDPTCEGRPSCWVEISLWYSWDIVGI